ncbi:MAG: FlgD immunoglobulin-like domain containing protein [Candidatus Tenebribacter burtonii]|nr:FlgD immunoglobulin-like domain containing protein [Candidatus Tenebribacter burtonii]
MNNRTLLIFILQILTIPLLFSQNTRENVSGIWNQPEYIIESDIVIASGDILIIQEGVTVKFNGNYKFEIIGSLFVLGSENSKVIFEPTATVQFWQGVVFMDYNWENNISQLNYLEIKNCNDINGGGMSILHYSNLLIDNLKISNCSAELGGGIYLSFAHPIIRNTEICNNFASVSGGGIYSHHCNLALENSFIHHNEAEISAGGAYFDYNRPSVTNCVFEYNTTQGYGGGIFTKDHYLDSEITNCIFRNNSAEMRGGAYYSDSGQMYIFSSQFEENYSYFGGACYLTDSSLSYTNCIFNNNNSEFGGAIHLNDASPKFINCLFSYNQSDFGGAVYSAGYSSAKFINSTFVRNNAIYGGGAYYAISDFNVEIYNSIFYFNTSDEDVQNQIYIGSSSSGTYIKYSAIQFGSDGIYCHPVNIQPPYFENNIFSDPQFADSYNDFTLLSSSPCINSGTLDLPIGIELPEYDLDGNLRIYEDIIDMGCYEWQGTGTTDDFILIAGSKLSNYPNPFNPTTTIKFELAESGKIDLSIYNIKGQKVKTLINTFTKRGQLEINWNGKDNHGKSVASGQYVVKLQHNGKETATKIMLLK